MTALVEEAVEIGDLVRLMTLQSGVVSMVEFTVPHDSRLIGRTIGSVPWPSDATVVAILRHDHMVHPRGDTVLRAGDEVIVLVTGDSETDVRRILIAE